MLRQRISYIAKSLYAATMDQLYSEVLICCDIWYNNECNILEQFGGYSYDMDITYVPLLAFGSLLAFVTALSWRITFDSCNDLGFAISTIV